jgi:hypothetical protein
MKFICKNCYYFKPASKGLPDKEYARCDATKELNLVTGEYTYNFCFIERESTREDACGAEGKYYVEEGKPEEWQRDEPQGVTNWDTGWNAEYAKDNGVM